MSVAPLRSAAARVCRARLPVLPLFASSRSLLPLARPSLRSFSTRSSRLPDTFDDIEDRDAHLQPVSERGLTADEFARLPADERQAGRERERDIMRIEDELAEQQQLDANDDDDYLRSAPLSALGSDSPGNYRTARPDVPLSWMLVQTNNPELIQPLPGSDPARPTTVRYPFIPVLAGERMRREASVLHRWLHYNRLRNTKQFLAVERKRRQLERQREHRDLAAHTDAAIAKLPTNHSAQPAATVRNAPSNVSREHFERNSPLGFDLSTGWMGEVLREMEGELRVEGRMSQAEKEALLNEAARVMRWAHRRMEKDKTAGYYRVMAEAGGIKAAAEHEQRHPAVTAPVRQLSSALRSGRVHGETTAQ